MDFGAVWVPGSLPTQENTGNERSKHVVVVLGWHADQHVNHNVSQLR
ncbi:MAG: hypothetical protein ACJAR2_002664 [Ilumatobacter sp.]|jgi:hypothetical protein